MRSTFKTLIVLMVAAGLLLLFRVLVCTIYTIPDDSLLPTVKGGDRVLVNRWSYGLRIGGNAWLGYTRWCRQPVKKGDFIAFDADSRVMMGRVVAVPGDTVKVYGKWYVIPRGCQVCTCDCASPCIVGANRHGGEMLVPESDIIGCATTVVYNFNNFQFDNSRWFLPIR